MSVRLLAVLFLLPALLLVVACGGDDDSGPVDRPGAAEGADDDDGDNGSAFNSSGSGTVVVGDETFDFQVDRCIQDVDGAIIIGGPSMTADGQEVYIRVDSLSAPHNHASVEVGIGSTSVFDVSRGNPTYRAQGYTADYEFIPDHVTNPDLIVEVNGEKHISFTATFFDREAAGFSARGYVEASCR